jgi:hypothetical protein
MALFSLTKDDDYASRKAAIARQEKLAEMLSQMGAQEQAVSTAGGITAPVSPMAALARGLTSFGGSYLSGKAAADEAALEKGEKAAIASGFADILKRGDIPASQGAQLPDDESGIEQYVVNPAQIGKGKYVLNPDEQQEALIKLVNERPGAAGVASSYSNLIEGERKRNEPTWRQPGDQLFTPQGAPVGVGVPVPPKITRMLDGAGGYYEFTLENGKTTTTHHAADDPLPSVGQKPTKTINGVTYTQDENGDWETNG